MTQQDRPLPPHVLRALDRIAAGAARTATHAHPDCACGTTNPISRRTLKAADCPQHQPLPADPPAASDNLPGL